MDNQRILTKIASNHNASVFYCKRKKNFFLNYNNRYQCFTAGQFISLWEQFNDIDLAAMINNSSPYADVEIVQPKGTDYIFVLSIVEIISLKQLINKSIDIVAPVNALD